MTAVNENTAVRNKLNEVANRIRDVLEQKGYRVECTLDDSNVLYIDIIGREDVKEVIEIVTSKDMYDRLKDIELVYRDIYIRLFKDRVDVEAKVTFTNGTISVDYFTVAVRTLWNPIAFWECMMVDYKYYFNKSERNRLEKFVEINEEYFIDLYEKAYKKLKEKAEEYVKEKLIEGWEDMSYDWDVGIELRVWKTTENINEIEGIIENLERYAESLLEVFEEELIGMLQETVKKFKTIREFEEYINREKLRRYVELLDEADKIYVVRTRYVYNKAYKTNIDAFKLLLHVKENGKCDIVDLAYLMKLDKVKFEYLAKNNTDFVVSVVGSDRIHTLLYRIALKVYSPVEALRKANKWMEKVKVLDR